MQLTGLKYQKRKSTGGIKDIANSYRMRGGSSFHTKEKNDLSRLTRALSKGRRNR